MEDPQSWAYFEYRSELKPKRTKVCVSCSHFRYSTTDSCVIIQTCPLHQRLIHGDEHLKKGCRFWKKDVRIFAPEAA